MKFPLLKIFIYYVIKLITLSIIFLLSACTSINTEFINNSELIQTQYFKHRYMYIDDSSSQLTVYIEGDGQAWLNRTRVAFDPTPYKPLMLQLFKKNNRGLYLARPCYFNSNDKACSPHYWTQLRYSKSIVNSMSQAIDSILLKYPHKEHINIVAHSGGATLALLLSHKRNDIKNIIAISANIDVNAWAKYHTYTPLQGLDPADYSELNPNTHYVFIYGENDEQTPIKLFKPKLKQWGIKPFVIKNQQHNCCWLDYINDFFNTLD